MSNEVGSLVVKMAADMARFESDMRQANRVSQDTMRQVAGNVDRGVNAIKGSMSAMAGAIGLSFSVATVAAFTKETITAALAVEKLNMLFKATTGSSSAAGRELTYIRTLSRDLGLDFQTTSTAYGKFLASTRDTSIEGAAAQKVFEGVSKASTALGLSADETSGIFLALSQMMSKGKVQAEELTGQLGERLPGALKLAANGMGMTTAELMKQMQEGKILSADLLPKLAAELEKTYGKAAVEASHKGQAGINRFNNEVKETAAAIGEKLMPMLNAAANTAARLLHTMRDTGSTKVIADGFDLPEDRAFVQRNIAAKSGNIDPQMARIEADRRAQQEVINAQRRAKEAWEAGKAEREKVAKEAEALAEQQRIAYNQGVQGYNRLVDALRASDPTLTSTQRQIAAINDEVAKLGQEHPEQKKAADRIGSRIIANLQLAEAIKKENAELKENIRLTEEALKDTAGFAAHGLAVDFGLKQKKQRYNLLGDSAGKPLPGGKFSLNGPSHTAGNTTAEQPPAFDFTARYGQQGQFDGMVNNYRNMFDNIRRVEDTYGKGSSEANAAIWGARVDMARDGMSMITGVLLRGNKEQFETGKALAEVMAVVDGALAIQKALASAPPPYNFIAAGLVGMATAIQVSTIQSQHYDGARANGGPVEAGKRYLVGERGPEVMEVGASGYIIPNERIGGGSVNIVNNYDFRNASPETEQRMKAYVDGKSERMKADILRDMNRGGAFASASGRR